MLKAVICMLRTQLQAEAIVTRLQSVGIQTGDISLLLLDRAGVLGLALDRDSHLSGRRATPAPPGGPAGGVLGMLSGIGIVAIPGSGLHITAGPLNAALCGDGKGSVVSGVAEGLVQMGVPMTRARQYEDQVKQGHILLAVQTWQADEVTRVASVLTQAHAEDLFADGESMRATN